MNCKSEAGSPKSKIHASR